MIARVLSSELHDVLAFLRRAGREGRIVSTGNLTNAQFTEAHEQGRLYVEPSSGRGWALVPWHIATEKDRLARGGRRARRRVLHSDA